MLVRRLNAIENLGSTTVLCTASGAERPSKDALLAYVHEVRGLSRDRLERTADDELDRVVTDEHYGPLTVRQVWVGVATSGAWHGRQIVLLVNRLPPRVGRT